MKPKENTAKMDMLRLKLFVLVPHTRNHQSKRHQCTAPLSGVAVGHRQCTTFEMDKDVAQMDR